MEPVLQTGDIAILYERERYEVGDIVAFEIPEGGTVIHRVAGIDPGGYRFQGDNRDAEDPWILGDEAIVGRQLISIPNVTDAMETVSQPVIMAVLVAALVALIGLKREAERRPPTPRPMNGIIQRRRRTWRHGQVQ